VRANACLSALGTRRNVVTLKARIAALLGALCKERQIASSLGIDGRGRSCAYTPISRRAELGKAEVEGSLSSPVLSASRFATVGVFFAHRSHKHPASRQILGLASHISWNLINRGVVSQGEASLVETTE
jgi:hypothetical protein